MLWILVALVVGMGIGGMLGRWWERRCDCADACSVVAFYRGSADAVMQSAMLLLDQRNAMAQLLELQNKVDRTRRENARPPMPLDGGQPSPRDGV